MYIYISYPEEVILKMKNAIDHLKMHQTYPASKADLVKVCNDLSDFPEGDKKWFMETLPEGTYKSAKDVLMALV